VVGTLLEYSGGFGGSAGSKITILQCKQRTGLPAASSGKRICFWQFAQVTMNTVALHEKSRHRRRLNRYEKDSAKA